MTEEIQEAIEDAKQEFAEYERLSDPIKRIICFRNAIDILVDILPKVSNEDQKYIINKMKLNRTRHLFYSILEMDFSDMWVWAHYRLATISVENELEVILAENPELKNSFERFQDLYVKEFKELAAYFEKQSKTRDKSDKIYLGLNTVR
jgi:hypothetical protein